MITTTINTIQRIANTQAMTMAATATGDAVHIHNMRILQGDRKNANL